MNVSPFKLDSMLADIISKFGTPLRMLKTISCNLFSRPSYGEEIRYGYLGAADDWP